MAQNVYDRPDFFEGYSQLNRSVHGLAGAAEWPSLQALVPNLTGRRVIDLGCGFGWFCRWAREQGASTVTGIDVSERMLERAKNETQDSAITYLRADLENLTLPLQAFDFAYSSLALHYIEDLSKLFSTVNQSLTPGSHFVFSVEHPIYMAPRHPDWIVDEDGKKSWPLNQYSIEGPRTTDWLSKGIIKQHRTIGTYVNLLVRHGFTLTHLEEWQPSTEQLKLHPEWAEERDRPMFLLFQTQKAG